jgi:hypothetical protein
VPCTRPVLSPPDRFRCPCRDPKALLLALVAAAARWSLREGTEKAVLVAKRPAIPTEQREIETREPSQLSWNSAKCAASAAFSCRSSAG